MARYRSRMALHPVNRIKHVVDNNITGTGGTQVGLPLVTANDAPTLANTVSVMTGSKVNGIYLRVETASDEVADVGAIPQVYMIVWKNPGGNLTAPAANVVGISDNKKYVIHQEMIMLQNVGRGGNARTLFNGVIVIPRGYRRFAPNDTLQIELLSPALNCKFCLQCHYKEFR